MMPSLLDTGHRSAAACLAAWARRAAVPGEADERPCPAAARRSEPSRRDQQPLRLPCVTARAEPVDSHHGLLADDPGVVAARQGGDVTGAGNELSAVVHPDRQPAADVVLEMRRLAASGARYRLHVLGPAPPRLKHQPPDLPAGDLEDLGAAVRKLARLVRCLEASVLGLVHHCPPLGLTTHEVV